MNGGPSDVVLRRLLRAHALMHDACAEPLSLEALAREARLSRFFFVRSFRAAFGVTPHQYLTRLRLERAKRALARGASVTEVCFDVGFASAGSFSTLFRRHVGLAPRSWQRRARTVVAVPAAWPALFIPSCFLWRFAPSNFGEAAPARAG